MESAGGWWLLSSWKSCQGLNDISSNQPGLMRRARQQSQSQRCGGSGQVTMWCARIVITLPSPAPRSAMGKWLYLNRDHRQLPAACWRPMMPPEKLSQRNSTTTLTEMKGNGEETWERELVIARVAAVVVTPGPGHRAANINRNEADNLSSGSLTSAID